MSKKPVSRRGFLKGLAAGVGAGFAYPLFNQRFTSAEPGKLRVASCGVGGMGSGDVSSIGSSGKVQFVAFCDVDKNNLAAKQKDHPNARTYQDFRVMFEKEAKEIDAVSVSTPDHMHGPIAMTALKLGKHVYCQKPLAHEIYECRQLAKVATEKKLVTQMGIQIHSHVAYRSAVIMIQEGAIGKVKQVHSWSNKVWGRKEGRPATTDPVPANLDWDLWLGVAPERPFAKGVYHPGDWRRWIDFGTGTQGDMACHIVDPVFTALKLGAPKRVWGDGPTTFPETWPLQGVTHYEYAATQYTTDDFKFTWYNGPAKPPDSLAPEAKGLPGQGSLFIGEKGMMLLPHIGGAMLMPRETFTGFKRPDLKGVDHYHQWVNACLGNGETGTPFSYSGPMTESVLMGLIACRFPGEKLEWDSENLAFKGHEKATAFVKRTFRKGWEVDGL